METKEIRSSGNDTHYIEDEEEEEDDEGRQHTEEMTRTHTYGLFLTLIAREVIVAMCGMQI